MWSSFLAGVTTSSLYQGMVAQPSFLSPASPAADSGQFRLSWKRVRGAMLPAWTWSWPWARSQALVSPGKPLPHWHACPLDRASDHISAWLSSRTRSWSCTLVPMAMRLCLALVSLSTQLPGMLTG